MDFGRSARLDAAPRGTAPRLAASLIKGDFAMTPPDLPEDPSDWPSDPFAILGLDRTAAAIEIKRAYTRLIKKYRPEQYPEEFRRIREAYDSCTAASRWILDAGFDSAPVTAPESPLPPLASGSSDEAAELWSLAESDPAAAYKGLVELTEREAERAELPLRLYWLLSIDAELDSWRSRHDWLATALRRSRLAGSAAELYRRELRIDPETALYSKPYIGILGANASPFDKLIVAQHRLSAAGRSHTWSPLSDDIAELCNPCRWPMKKRGFRISPPPMSGPLGTARIRFTA